MKILETKFVEGQYIYKIEAPISWWASQADGKQKIKLSKPDIARFNDSQFDTDELFTPCEDEDRGSTKILFYLIQTMNNYLTDYEDTNDDRFLGQIRRLLPVSFMITGTIETDESKEFEMS